jgi:hypothetical protein
LQIARAPRKPHRHAAISQQIEERTQLRIFDIQKRLNTDWRGRIRRQLLSTKRDELRFISNFRGCRAAYCGVWMRSVAINFSARAI